MTDLSPITVDATAIEKEKKRNDDDSDKDEPLRRLQRLLSSRLSGEPTFSTALEDGESVGSRRRVRGDGIENDETFHGGLREAKLTPEEEIGYALGVPTDKLNETQKKYALQKEKRKKNRHAVERVSE